MKKNPITIEALETLDAIDRRGTYAKAAEELNKTTSALSYIVQRLEEQLDLALFQRQGRRAVLTPPGRLLLAEGREILETVNKLAGKAKEVASGWESRIRIAIESIAPYRECFALLAQFVRAYPTIELDIQECVLNGGWELIDEDKVDLVIGLPGPVPKHKGVRAVELRRNDLRPVISSSHEYAALANDKRAFASVLPKIRRVITRDTSAKGIKRSAGLASDGMNCYVQTLEQKIEAIRAGIGVGHLPQGRIKQLIADGELLELEVEDNNILGNFMVWKIENKGRGLKAMTDLFANSTLAINEQQ